MTYFIGRSFAELQILKKWKWPFLLNWVEYCDEILHTYWYWNDVAHEIVKYHLELVEVLPRFKFWKQCNLTLKPFGIFWLNLADTLILTRSSWRNCKMTFIIGRGWAERQILKKMNIALSLELSGILWWNFAYTLKLTWCSPWDSQMIYGIGRGVAEVQILKTVKFNS